MQDFFSTIYTPELQFFIWTYLTGILGEWLSLRQAQ